MVASLIIPSFIAGLLTFLAPCTLPLVPIYLGFLGGVTATEFRLSEHKSRLRAKIFFHALLYVLGFSTIFIFMGTALGTIATFLSVENFWITRISGLLIIFLGLSELIFVLNIPSLRFLQWEKKFPSIPLKTGRPLSAFLLGATFALGWSPCIGPILGTVLMMASTTTTILQGTFLLSVFSLGLALPFLLLALGMGSGSSVITKTLSRHGNIISIISGIFLIVLGYFLFTNQTNLLLLWFHTLFWFLPLDGFVEWM